MKWLLVVGAAAIVLVATFVFRASTKMPDFEVYWRAGQRAMAAEPLYRAEDQHYQLKYLPAFAILAIPAAVVPLPIAKGIWFSLSAALIVALLALSLALVPSRDKAGWILVTLTFVAMAKFYGHELVLGQVNLLLAAIVLLAVRASQRGRPIVVGSLTALAVIVKPYAVIFLPWLMARRQIRAAATALAGIVVALLLPMAIYGARGTITLHEAWWTTVSESTAPNLLNPDNVSLAAMYAKWLGPGSTAAWLAIATTLVLLAATGLAFVRRRRVPAPEALEASLLLTLIPLLSPQGWDYVFLMSTPAVMLLINYDRRLPAPVRIATSVALATIAFSIYDLLGRRAYATFMELSIISVCFLVVCAALVALRLRQVA